MWLVLGRWEMGRLGCEGDLRLRISYGVLVGLGLAISGVGIQLEVIQ
jgi:hypothetical protein